MAEEFNPMEVGKPAKAPTSDGQPRPANDLGRDVLSYVERIERLEAEKQTIADDIKSVKEEYASKGYDKKILAEMLKLRKMEPDVRKEWEDLRDTYGHAIGIFG
jgi:uncharacterized protein (UPF0335 family)